MPITYRPVKEHRCRTPVLTIFMEAGTVWECPKCQNSWVLKNLWDEERYWSPISNRSPEEEFASKLKNLIEQSSTTPLSFSVKEVLDRWSSVNKK